ncbi:MAG: DNA polymerase III subunit epsilon [Bdellovibrionaceae bacterium]|nr:DNA polymerase III subunit epsilon [Bdellovibrionales bacterium]MCB9254081.1 DNA polymerase III subunit epsilon [Pseudobdellovibrionaceae bacterium]
MGLKFRWLGMAPDGKTITLRRYGGEVNVPTYVDANWLEANAAEIGIGIGLDVETTGLRPGEDQIIEIGLQEFRFHRNTGEMVSLDGAYAALQDPGMEISPGIERLTGITNDAVRDQQIDWGKVQEYFERAEMVVAHNAGFDRAFLDRALPLSREKLWACSCSQVDWHSKGFNTRKLEVLNIYHGFFTDSHRALHDVEALLYLLSLPAPDSDVPYLKELLENAVKPRVNVIAANSPYETKDILRQRGYRWDPQRRYWSKAIYQEEEASEKEWLTNRVYGGRFAGKMESIPLTDNFKMQ